MNLFLAVGPKDRRGYHPLRTVFQEIDLCDEITIEPAETTSVEFDDPSIPSENTVTKALRLLSEIVTVPTVRVQVKKVIPSESGLGGGSSNAAAILRAIPRMVGKTMPTGELAGIAAAIGADVPFFLVGGRAKGEGYGEKLVPIAAGADEWYVVARPEVSCPTGEAYRKLDDLTYEWRAFPEGDELYNDFERVAPCESLDLIERLLALGARDAALSGSGSAVFGRFAREEVAKSAASGLSGVRAWLAKPVYR